MNIAIIGTRGIPNRYGGFEQFAENISVRLVDLGHKITVYSSHKHPYQKKEYKGVRICHCFDPEKRLGTAGQFIYDFNCIRHARKQNYDVILQLGYTSSSVWGWMLPRKNCVVTTNMDGLEWKRQKFSPPVRRFLRYAEKLAIRYSDHLISDSVGIQQYLKKTRGASSTFIPYGANLFDDPDERILEEFNLQPFGYNLVIARLEPENSIETILNAIVRSKRKQPFVLVGNTNTAYGRSIMRKFAGCPWICFAGGIFDMNILNNLRHFSNLYFHGHTVGGTNPSLLEAMASDALVCAHDNVFNKSVLGGDAFYFKNINDILNVLDEDKLSHRSLIDSNRKKIKHVYSWPQITDQYLAHFEMITKKAPSFQFTPKGIPAQSQTGRLPNMANK